MINGGKWVIFVCVCIAGIGVSLKVIVFLCRFLKRPSKCRLIKCYVDPAAYDRLQLMADDHDLSLSTFCSLCLECVNPVDLSAADDRMGLTSEDEPRYCELCGCVCVACVQLADGCDSCELKHPELISDI